MISREVSLIIFNAVILVMLWIDIKFSQKEKHFPKMKEAIAWTIVWIIFALLFAFYIHYEYGPEKTLEYLTGYIIEKALSIDNVFVFIVIFSYFSVPNHLQHKVLFWGILSAIILRAIFIVVGASLISQFHWILYILGLFLIFTAIKLALQKETELHPEKNPVIKMARKLFPVTQDYEGNQFFIKKSGKYYATPLFLVLIMIETTDIAFATDSIPAIFAITTDPFIIYTSNICAILGLRALYFVASGFLKQFHYLKYGLSIVLGYIGLKMLIQDWYKIPVVISLLIVFGIITISILISIYYPKKR